MPLPPKPKRVTIGPLAPPTEDVVTTRRRMWAGWLDDCANIHDVFVEAMLANIVKDGPDG